MLGIRRVQCAVLDKSRTSSRNRDGPCLLVGMRSVGGRGSVLLVKVTKDSMVKRISKFSQGPIGVRVNIEIIPQRRLCGSS